MSSNFHASEGGENRRYRGPYDLPVAREEKMPTTITHGRYLHNSSNRSPPKTPPRARVKVDSTRVGVDTSMTRQR